MAISTFPAASGGGGGKIQKIDKITSTQSWTAPSDVSEVELIISGGGGGGCQQSGFDSVGGGGGGSVFYEIISVTGDTSYTVTIGGGGARGTGSSSGSTGSSSSLGGLFTATGGSGGASDGKSGSGAGLGGDGSSAAGFSNDEVKVVGMVGFHGLGKGGGLDVSNRIFPGNQGAVANTGNGGVGANLDGSAASTNGSSGVAIIKYWTAG